MHRSPRSSDASLPEGPPGSRLAAVSRRTFLLRSVVIVGGAAAAGGLVACGSNGGDAQVLGSENATDVGAATTATAASGATETTGASPTTGASVDAGPIPDAAELAVSFTYTPSDAGGRVENPYVAVWIEAPSETLVSVLGVWYQSGRKEKYLAELSRWSATGASATALDTVSSATRTPGDYQLVWDGTDLDGARVPTGDYVICIESAREHGPHSLIRQSVALGAEAASVTLTDDGELSGATADYHLA